MVSWQTEKTHGGRALAKAIAIPRMTLYSKSRIGLATPIALGAAASPCCRIPDSQPVHHSAYQRNTYYTNAYLSVAYFWYTHARAREVHEQLRRSEVESPLCERIV